MNQLHTYFKDLVKVSFWLFGVIFDVELIGCQNLHNFWVEKALMSPYTLCKILSF